MSSRIVSRSSTNLLLAIVSNLDLWNRFNSSISLRLVSSASRRSQFCFNNCSWTSWWSCRNGFPRSIMTDGRRQTRRQAFFFRVIGSSSARVKERRADGEVIVVEVDHSGTAARPRIPGCSVHKPPWCGTPWVHNLWEARSRPRSSAEVRRIICPLHPGRWSYGQKNRVIREKMVRKKWWMEMSEREQQSNTPYDTCMDEVSADPNLSQACSHVSLWKWSVWSVVFTNSQRKQKPDGHAWAMRAKMVSRPPRAPTILRHLEQRTHEKMRVARVSRVRRVKRGVTFSTSRRLQGNRCCLQAKLFEKFTDDPHFEKVYHGNCKVLCTYSWHSFGVHHARWQILFGIVFQAHTEINIDVDPSVDVGAGCISIPYWSRKFTTLTRRTGSI